MVDPNVIGPEEVPLTEDVIKQPARQLFPTASEWASDNVEQIIEQTSSFATETKAFYTVPDNHTLFITSAWLSTACSVAAAQRRAILEATGTAASGANPNILSVRVNAAAG